MADKNLENDNKEIENLTDDSENENKEDHGTIEKEESVDSDPDKQETSEIESINGNEVLVKDRSEDIDDSQVFEDQIEETSEDDLVEDDDLDEEDQEEKEIGIVGTLFSVIGNTIFALFLIVLLLIVGLNVVSFARGEEISLLGKRMYIIGEDTMDPMVSEDDAIIVEEISAENVNEGDFIVYETVNGDIVTGWVTNQLDDDRLEIKKDINSDTSIIIDGIALIGVATLKVANMGEFIDFLSNPISLLIILLVGILIYMFVWLISNLTKRLAD